MRPGVNPDRTLNGATARVWIVLWVIVTFVAAAALLIVAMYQLRSRLDAAHARIDRLSGRVAQLREQTADLDRLRARVAELENRLGGIPTRVARLEVPLCDDFRRRAPPQPNSDDQPAAPNAVNVPQWRRVAQLVRHLGLPACIRDIRADNEPDAPDQREVVVSLDAQRTIEIDLYADGRVAEVELLVSFSSLPAPIRQQAFARGCRPQKTELSVRKDVTPEAVRQLLDEWRPSAQGQFPPLREDIIVEFDCGSALWDLELKADGTMLRRNGGPATTRR